jgi:hypothetical protein
MRLTCLTSAAGTLLDFQGKSNGSFAGLLVADECLIGLNLSGQHFKN